ncbi:hypothetical protein SLEP1_g6199 [Rubroshorea leprosula]|uniref:Uncharacterized protein n=1 Tax=Rubroshorea leprosula TaxID=152421 RepID=A0AAV5I0D5_9ROSI|nr:hypothetical protein SLEP1_g6199 [Rubroshorea leprosula]
MIPNVKTYKGQDELLLSIHNLRDPKCQNFTLIKSVCSYVRN